MSRARNIKPGFFKNDLLAECDPLARILFAGLWCEADREGRLEDRPKRIKADCLPYDDCDADVLLDELAERGFISRYKADGSLYIAILEFGKHQNPHVKEQASQIPAPCKPGASTVQVQGITETSPEVATLIPDSLIPHPDSMQKHRGAKAPPLALPNWLAKDSWDEWHKFRNGRKGWTRKSQELSLSTLTKLRTQGHDPTTVIEQSIERGWTGLFAIKPEANNGIHQSGRRESTAERAARFAREGDEADARRAQASHQDQRHAPVLAEDGSDLRSSLDVGVR